MSPRLILASALLSGLGFVAGCGGGDSRAGGDRDHCVNNEQPNCGNVRCGDGQACAEGRCVCPLGFEPVGLECVDLDECAAGNGGCSDRCTNVEGGFECECDPGRVLGIDGRTCAPDGPCPGCRLCADTGAIEARVETTRAHHETLTAGLPERPIARGLPEDTNGTQTTSTTSWLFGCSEQTDGGENIGGTRGRNGGSVQRT